MPTHRSATRSPCEASFPTPAVPVPTQIGRIAGDRDDVTGPGCDVAGAARAHVSLGRLVGLDPAHLAVRCRRVVDHDRRSSAEEGPDDDDRSDDECSTDVEVVPVRPSVLAMRVHAHVQIIAPRPGTGPRS